MKTKPELWEIIPELAEVDRCIVQMLQSYPESMAGINSSLIKMRGKKLRPALFLTAARMHWTDLSNVIPIAVSLELIHTATLLHDDVLDNAKLRRNKPTVNALWGNHMAVLLGDYLFARAFTLLTSYGNNDITELIVNMVEEMSLGEIQQQIEVYNPALTEEDYLKRVEQKTALFIASCCLAGYLTADTTAELRSAFYNYGLNLGIAFQIIDDVLDFSGKEKNIGKDTCSDLRNGIITLPLIYTLQFSSRKEEIYSWIKEKSLSESQLQIVLDEIKREGGLDYSIKMAERYVDEALIFLEIIPAKHITADLKTMSRLVFNRIPDYKHGVK